MQVLNAIMLKPFRLGGKGLSTTDSGHLLWRRSFIAARYLGKGRDDGGRTKVLGCTVGEWPPPSPALAASVGWCLQRGVWRGRWRSAWARGSGACVDYDWSGDPVVWSKAVHWCRCPVAEVQTGTLPCCPLRLTARPVLDGAQACLSFPCVYVVGTMTDCAKHWRAEPSSSLHWQ